MFQRGGIKVDFVIIEVSVSTESGHSLILRGKHRHQLGHTHYILLFKKVRQKERQPVFVHRVSPNT